MTSHVKEPGGAAPRLHLATNQYPWMTFYRRDGRNFAQSLATAIDEVGASGLDGYEPLVEDIHQLEALVPLLQQRGLAMRSLYVNSTLHLADAAETSIARILAIAEQAQAAGTRFIVTNPTPLRWGGPEDKDDAQLRTQAAALNRLGERLAARGLTLAYHHHDAELRHAARELHHMLNGTDPALVTLCLDAHWVYRGAGNSCVALFDILQLYGARVTELHVRQSAGGIWTEAFGPGDIDYAALAAALARVGVRPHLVLEQAVQAETPKTLDALTAHRRGVAYAREVFAGLAD